MILLNIIQIFWITSVVRQSQRGAERRRADAPLPRNDNFLIVIANLILFVITNIIFIVIANIFNNSVIASFRRKRSNLLLIKLNFKIKFYYNWITSVVSLPRNDDTKEIVIASFRRKRSNLKLT